MDSAQGITIINLLIYVFIVTLVFFHKYILHRQINLLALLIIIAILPTLSMFRTGTYESGDLSIHVAYSLSFFNSLREGDLIPVWSNELNAGYGYPLFGFSYILPYYLTSFSYLLGLSMITSTKIVFALSFILSGLSMYFFAKEEFKKKFIAFGASILYLFSPYHLINLHFRADIGEIVSFVFIPLVFLFSKLTDTHNNYVWYLANAISIFLLIISHQGAALIIIPFLFLYILLLCKNKIAILSSLFSGIGLASFYWLPLLVEKKYTYPATDNFSHLELVDIVFSPYLYGFLYQGPTGQLAFPVGYVHIALLIITIRLLLMKAVNINKRTVLFFIFCGFFYLLMTQGFTKSIWDLIPIAINLQFSYRLMIGAIFFLSLAASIPFLIIKREIAMIIFFLVIVITIPNWSNRNIIKDINDDIIYENAVIGGIGLNPALPRWLPEWKTQKPSHPIKTNTPSIKIDLLDKTSTKRHYYIVSDKSVLMEESISFFPGWTAKFNGSELNIKPNKQGLISFDLPKGEGHLVLEYKGTEIRQSSKIISILSLLFVFFYILLLRAKYSTKFSRMS